MRHLQAATAILVGIVSGWSTAAAAQGAALSARGASSSARGAAAEVCKVNGPTVPVAGLFEGSGLAASRVSAGRYWTHNDSGEPILFSLDAQGAVTGKLTVTGANVIDWEALASGPCPGGSCLFVGDIGDNDARRRQITVYRFPEPAGAALSANVVEAFHAQYPDGAHDAETLLVGPDGGIYVVTKGDTGPIAIYRFPKALRAGSTHRLERVVTPRQPDGKSERITDGSMSSNGAWIALRTERALTFYRAAELLSGTWRAAGRVDLSPLAEPQGEGVAFASDTTLALAGEGGGKSRPGTFARLTCVLGPTGS